jgi:hypothetical protein
MKTKQLSISRTLTNLGTHVEVTKYELHPLVFIAILIL